MMHTNTTRPGHGALSSALGGALWLASGMLGQSIGSKQPIADLLLIAALPLLLATLLGLATQLRARLGAAEYVVRSLAWLGAGMAGIARIATLLLGTSFAAPFGLGIFLLSAALIVLGSRALRTANEASWEGLLLLVGLLGLFLPVGAGVAGVAGLAAWAVWGAGWICLGNVLWQSSMATSKSFSWRETVERTRR